MLTKILVLLVIVICIIPLVSLSLRHRKQITFTSEPKVALIIINGLEFGLVSSFGFLAIILLVSIIQRKFDWNMDIFAKSILVAVIPGFIIMLNTIYHAGILKLIMRKLIVNKGNNGSSEKHGGKQS